MEGGDRAAGSDGNTADNYGDQLMKTTLAVLKHYICNYVRQHGGDTGLLPGVEESTDPEIQKVADGLRKFGDELDARVDFQSLMQNCLPMTRENFMKVAKEVFSDNKYNWGRVVTLFIFACRLVMKAIADKIRDIVKDIMAWTLEFMKKNVLDWIQRQGGWEASLSNVNDKPGWKKCLFLGGLSLVVVFVIVRKCKGTRMSLDN